MFLPRSSQHCGCTRIPLPIALRAFLRASGILPLTLMLLCVVSVAMSSYAQATTAILTIILEDPKGALISGADVVLSNSAQGTQRSGSSNSEGAVVFVLVPPGTYSLTITATGFAPTEIKQLTLNVNDQRELTVQLSLGTVSQTVEVVDGAPLINESAAIGTTVNRQFIENIPANGRSFQSLITLSPGVVLTKASVAEQGQFSVNGQRADANYFMIDGVGANIGVSPGNNAGQSTAGALPGVSTAGGTNNLVSMDALQEFKILTSTYAPEFGRTPGGQVSIITRSGTNQFRGTVFEYFRNDALDATDWFANQSGQPKPALRQNDFGGVLGGPLYFPRFGEGGPSFHNGKNRAFFFFSYEGLRLRLPQTAQTVVPSLAARQAAPAAIRPFLNAFPRPNGRDLVNNFSEFTASYSDPSSLDAVSLRTDFIANSKLTFFARYNYAPSESAQRGSSGASSSTVLNTTIKTQTLTAGATMAINPTTNNDLRVNYSRNEGESFFTMDSFGGAVAPPESILFPSPITSRDGFFFLSLGVGNPNWQLGKFQTDMQRQVNVVDNLSLVSSRHHLKFGVDYRRLFPVFERVSYSQSPTFSGVNGAVTGRATRVTIQAFNGPRFPVFTNLSLFAQDSWRVSSRLLLTFGTRWELNPAPSESTGKEPFAFTNLDNPSKLAVSPAGTPIFKTTYNNFAPRVGVAYRISQANGRETVLRGGFGVFYDLGTGTIAGAFGSSFPYFRSRQLAPVGGLQFPLDAATAAPPPFNPNPPFSTLQGVVDPNFKLPYTYQWNVAIERSLGFNQIVSASYVAAVGRRLTRQEFLLAPAAGFGSVFATRNSATSDYHALQLQLQRRLFNGLQYVASYTWSHSIDNVSVDSSFEVPATRIDPAQERGSSDFDVRHSLTGAVTYDVPVPFDRGFGNPLLRNFSVDTIFTARSATPVNVITGLLGVGGIGVSRPDLIEGIPLYIQDSTVAGGRRINPAAFTVPVGRQGTLGRNALRGFSAWQMDLALRRRFQLTEQVNLQLRAEFFNIFNHPNFGDPGAAGSGTNSLINPRFGRSVVSLARSLGSGGSAGGFNPLFQIGGPRSIQLALRLNF